jgi:hypothetical protein
MRNGTFNTSKCRGKLQKMGVLYTHSPKSPRKKLNKKLKNCKKLGVQQSVKARAAANGQLWHEPPFLYIVAFFF